MKSSKKLFVVIVILALGGATALGLIALSHQRSVAEAAARQELNNLGVLVTMDSNQQHVQGVALLPGVPQEDLEQAIKQVTKLPRLEVLRLAGTGVTDDLLAQVANRTSLTMIDLGKTQISDAGLAHLQNLNHLQFLYLTGTPVTDQGLVSIGKLNNLKILDLSKTNLEGDLASLLPLDQLKHLLLSGVPLRGDAVDHLLQLKSLSRLTITGSVLDEESKSKLDQANFTIDRASESDRGSEQGDEPADQG